MSRLTHLECTRCGHHFPATRPQTVCPNDGGILYARYDLATIKRNFSAANLAGRAPTMWRYDAILPEADPVTLGEGFTPMLASREYPSVFIKDEGLNPTGSFKARGLSAAVTMARHFGLKKLAIPSAGNAAGALAAYAAAAGLEAHIFMPKDVPMANRIECDYYGAHVTLVDGLISDCARIVAEGTPREGWFDVSTLKEPYRIEGKKTMGYELAEQLGWELPDAIFYPTGGGVGMIGMWKAFEEMEALGWIGPKRPKMIAVQAEGCQPVVRAFNEGAARSRFWDGAATVASGLRVPKPLGDFLVLQAVRESGGTAVAVADTELIDAGIELATEEGIFVSPEGAACVAGARNLLRDGFLKRDDKIVIYNTGSGLKYLEAYSTRFPRVSGGETGKLGGLITPR
jgi:threonine synthase